MAANRGAIQRGMIFSWAKHDMAGALDYIAGIESEGRRADLSSAIVAHMLSMNHPVEKAWDFAASLPEGSSQRGREMVNVLDRMSRTQPELAAARLEQLPTDGTRRAAQRCTPCHGTGLRSQSDHRAQWRDY